MIREANEGEGVYWSTSPMISSCLIWFPQQDFLKLGGKPGLRSRVGSGCACLGALRVLTAPAFSPKLCPDVQEYSCEIMRVNFCLRGLMEVKVSNSTTGHLMERRFIILIRKMFDVKYSLTHAPYTLSPNTQVLIPKTLSVTYMAKETL